MMKETLPFGVQYYPEHWPEERWEEDARLMASAHVNTVRMGEFAWSRHEPGEGKVDFTWLERTIDLFGKHGIRTILCTCSRTPPLWLYKKHPCIVAREMDGTRKATDHRYHVGLEHPDFVRHAKRIDEAMIRHFSGNPNISGWQIDNEVGSNNDCFCDTCLSSFHKYLEEEYRFPNVLNAAWGEHFWAYRINRFDEIPLPRENPQALLAYRKFMSHVNREFSQWRADKIRELDPGKPVTTNFQNLYTAHTDYHMLDGILDFNGMNHYPARTPELALDFYRADRGTFWVMEQQTHLADKDLGKGCMRLHAWKAFAHGANALIYFRWRQCRWGREQFGDGILPHSGGKRRLYNELVRIGREIESLGKRILDTRPASQVAILYAYPSRWAVETAMRDESLDPVREALQWHQTLARRVTAIDALDPHMDIGSYKMVIAPRLWMMDERIAANLRAFVEDGGTLCLTAGSGVVDTHGVSFETPRPGLLSELAGIELSDLAFEPGMQLRLKSDMVPALDNTDASDLAEEIQPGNAAVVASHGTGWRSGYPAITLNPVGKGRVLYIGTILGSEGMTAIVDWLLRDMDMERRPPAQTGVSIRQRRGPQEDLLFLMNWNEQTETVSPGDEWKDALTGESGPEFTVEPIDLRILSRAR